MGHRRGGGRWGEHTKKADSPNEILGVFCVRYDGIDHEQGLHDARLAPESWDHEGDGSIGWFKQAYLSHYKHWQPIKSHPESHHK